MKFRKVSTKGRWAAVSAAALLAVSACGDAGSDSESETGEYEVVESPEFEDGTRMAELAEQGSIKIGVKYDQPGIGFKSAGQDDPSGMDIEMGKIMAATVGGAMPLVAKSLRVDPAVFSNPFISTFVDATGLIVYFLIARTVLGL